MYIEDAANLADPVMVLTPILMMLVLASLVACFIPAKFFERLAWRFEGAGMLGLGAIFGCAVVLVNVVSPFGPAGFINF